MYFYIKVYQECIFFGQKSEIVFFINILRRLCKHALLNLEPPLKHSQMVCLF